MLRTSTFGGLAGNSESTIFGGVIELIHYGNWGVAAVVFLASIVVPIGKFLAIGWLGRGLFGGRVGLGAAVLLIIAHVVLAARRGNAEVL